ncbi:class I SAM-dependent methyltransferase [Stackebrandtia nassauensis]|uniref:Methyltransferase type 12 n=1 Tax=Stackebrandtia nassauensis (strain DSM 44728 / CIP 108903 / NRRL B-16338 / NBRC 102104 / LLR-40K-21) TaxID=446470 RepID=D3PZG5_STANL|nr:class I SAM-dependent methyltransferase [Stackebrandtia nassauensis]ADD41639.1 Methyltransferase type 12 [Stackebrandtia nassauensis DSM 44728]
MDTTPDYRVVNAANWDERVPIHLASDFYDLDGFRQRRDSLNDYERAEMGDVDGKSLVHLQCHFGRDTLSWAKYGATVAGVDFSALAIEAARELAAELGIDASFVTADVYDAAEALGGRTFDIVYTGIGALCWLPDLTRWAETVARLLVPGGFLYLTEFHPVVDALDGKTGTHVDKDYFDTEPSVYDETPTYTDGGENLANGTTVEFHHTLGDIITALAAAGLRIEWLREHDFTLFQQFAGLRRRDDGTFVYEGTGRAPLMFSVKATRA